MTAGCLRDVDVMILAGGLGTRLRDVLGAETPKFLAPIDGRPFADYAFAWLKGFGARRVILALGHRAQAVVAHIEAAPPEGLEVVWSIEPEPLGTAGGIAFAAGAARAETVLVLNGDSFIDADLCAFLAAYRASGAEGAVLCAEVDDAGRYGRVVLDAAGRIVRFEEKRPDAGPGAINAGVYLFSRGMLARIAAAGGPSLEKDVFEKLPPGHLAGHLARGAAFIDIGTPESLARAAAVLRRLRVAPASP